MPFLALKHHRLTYITCQWCHYYLSHDTCKEDVEGNTMTMTTMPWCHQTYQHDVHAIIPTPLLTTHPTMAQCVRQRRQLLTPPLGHEIKIYPVHSSQSYAMPCSIQVQLSFLGPTTATWGTTTQKQCKLDARISGKSVLWRHQWITSKEWRVTQRLALAKSTHAAECLVSATDCWMLLIPHF